MDRRGVRTDAVQQSGRRQESIANNDHRCPSRGREHQVTGEVSSRIVLLPHLVIRM